VTVTKTGDLKYLKGKENGLSSIALIICGPSTEGPVSSRKLSTNNMLGRRFAIAPMMEWIREFKFFK